MPTTPAATRYDVSDSAASHVYDSATRPPPVVDALRALRDQRGLLTLLVNRSLIVRYKRSVIGLWWTLLHPLLTAAILYMVFSNLFEVNTGDVPYVVYLVSGVLLSTLFATTVQAVGGSILEQTVTLTRLRVQPVLFAASAAIASVITFLVGVVTLLGLQLITGEGIPWQVPLAVFPIVSTVMFATGVGLIVAAVAARFADALDVTRVVLQLIGWLTPTFYTTDIVPDGFRHVIDANPVTANLVVFRELIYGAPGSVEWWSIAIAAGSAVVFLALGIVVFAKMWRRTVTML